MTIFLKVTFNFPFDLHWVCLRFCARSNVGAWLSILTMTFFFLIGFRHFFHGIAHLVGPPHRLTINFHIAFVVNLWTLWGSTFFIVPMVGRKQVPMMLCGCIYLYHEIYMIICFICLDPHSSTTSFSIFALLNQHFGFNG
jgi:hypothetical protein